MKNFLHFTGILTLLLTGDSASATVPVVNDIQLATYGTGPNAFYGEPQSLIETKQADIASGQACTKCVGHHGLCVIGEGNCYPPDGCYFCGGCTSKQARCQNPNGGEACQCYP